MSESRTVIVTGAGRGIGAVIAQRLAREGDTVFALDRDVAEVGEGITGIACDITSDADVAAAVERVLAATARIDVLVNNAGINLTGPLETADLDAVRACFDVNVVGLLRMCQAVTPTMKRAGTGRIVNAASFAAIVPAIGGGAYAATKSAVVQLTRALAGELGPWDITVNAYAPGMVPTAMNGFADMPAAQQDELLDTLTLRRWGTADEVADVVAFLASPAARYVTSTLIDVSGGKLATQIPARAHRAAEA